MEGLHDGPASSLFSPVGLDASINFDDLESWPGITSQFAAASKEAIRGSCTAWGIPFKIEKVIVLDQKPVEIAIKPLQTRWLVFLHTSDQYPLERNPGGLVKTFRGEGRLNELAAAYIIQYSDGSEARSEIRRRHQIGAFNPHWGENCFQAVAQHKPHPLPPRRMGALGRPNPPARIWSTPLPG